ncbi:Uncharacterized protein TCM_004756 [Theobroma cacao]|uniref:Uncharacterized protein n=1 Tax=Theobroma cacao TaxID=3641 RepID=A0A061DR09_THECC|nr:Uncharacterized protein TCM_004756 [Theobroma cacao]
MTKAVVQSPPKHEFTGSAFRRDPKPTSRLLPGADDGSFTCSTNCSLFYTITLTKSFVICYGMGIFVTLNYHMVTALPPCL